MQNSLWKTAWDATKGWFILISGVASIASFFVGNLTGSGFKVSMVIAIVVLLIFFIIRFLYFAYKVTQENVILKKKAINDETIRPHDLAIFEASNEILSEEDLKGLIQQLMTDSRYFRSQSRAVGEILHYFDETGNYYLNDNIISPIKKFLFELRGLKNFFDHHFFIHPNDQQDRAYDDYTYYLYPELRWPDTWAPEKIKLFKERENELDSICGRVQDSFREYRLSIKHNLRR